MLTRLRMNMAAVIAALAWFGFQTVTVLREHGYSGFFALAQANSATNLLLLDVTIFVVLASAWMVRDARRALWAVPFVILAVTFGAAGPLAYLLARPRVGRGAKSAA